VYCKYYYRRDYTAILRDITPPNVAANSEVWFHIDPRHAHASHSSMPSGEPPYRSIHMGQYLMLTHDIIADTDRLNGFSNNQQYAIMGEGASMNSTDPRVMFYNGLAQVLRSATHCNFAGDDCWVVRVHPRIKTVNYN